MTSTDDSSQPGPEDMPVGARIETALVSGEVADFTLPSDPGELPGYDDAFWNDRSIDGEWFAEWINANQVEIHRRGVRIAGLRIENGLDLSNAELSRPISLARCQLGEHPFDFSNATTRGLQVLRSEARSLTCVDATIQGAVFCTGSAKFSIADSTPGRSLILDSRSIISFADHE